MNGGYYRGATRKYSAKSLLNMKGGLKQMRCNSTAAVKQRTSG